MTATATATTTAAAAERVGFSPALLAVVTRDADTDAFLATVYAWIDEAHPDVPIEPAKFFTAEFGDLSDPDDILYEFGATLQLPCPVIVRQEWV